jgi:hypothetical protein
MNQASSAINTEEPPRIHALEAYASYLNELEHNNYIERLKNARRFISAYPDLAQWQELKLIDRIGSNNPRRGLISIFWLNINASYWIGIG